jgi:hypothetical protein
MSQKKLVGRNVAIALGIACIILVAGIGGVMAYYMMQINNKDSAYNDYVKTHSHTDTQYGTLNSTYNDYVATHSHTNSEYDAATTNHHHTDDEYNTAVSNYNNEVNIYNNYVNDHHYTDEQYAQAIANKPAKLIAVDLKSDDNRPFLGTPYLHVYGYLCNVGGVAAINVRVHVVAYQSGGVIAINTDIVLGSIAGEAWIKVDGSPTYTGGSLTGWTITPTWS